MKKRVFFTTTFVALTWIAFPARKVLAEDPAIPPPSTWLGGVTANGPDYLTDLMKARNWDEAVTTIIPAFFQLTFFITILFCLALVVRAGFMFILAEGNKEGLVKARTALVQAFIGFGLVFSVFLIFNVIQQLLGVNLTGNQ